MITGGTESPRELLLLRRAERLYWPLVGTPPGAAERRVRDGDFGGSPGTSASGPPGSTRACPRQSAAVPKVSSVMSKGVCFIRPFNSAAQQVGRVSNGHLRFLRRWRTPRFPDRGGAERNPWCIAFGAWRKALR